MEKDIINAQVAKKINRAFQGISNGRITLVIKNSEIVKIDISEKTHKEDVWIFGEGGGI